MNQTKKDMIQLFVRRVCLIAMDIVLINMSVLLALLMRFNVTISSIPEEYIYKYEQFMIPFTLIALVVFWFCRIYHSLWEYASITELYKIVEACTITEVIHVCVTMMLELGLPRSTYFMTWVFLVVSVSASRFMYRFIRTGLNRYRTTDDDIRIMIIGAGNATNVLIREIIFAIPSASPENRRDILSICKETDCELKILPGVYQMVDGEINIKDIRRVDVLDLLGRNPVEVDIESIMGYVKDKVVLVTGGGGSIGSELCRQLVSHKPRKLIIFDIYENNAYDIQQELCINHADANVETLIGSVRNVGRLEDIFRKYHPDIIYHAAAHKHVPLMEVSPNEAVKNNVIGTYNVARMADKYGAEKFVLISTDKAVNPTNVMGATKRICEMIVQSFNEKSDTDYVAVRFGNVLGSNGSVIPLFKKQIEAGGPVTVTDPNIIRYFMTIPEAVSLVLQAGAYARGGEIFVLDMGEPVKIDDLAKNLIRLSGYTLGVDMNIVYTGLRPGEKLYEELLMDEEGLQETANKLIHIGKPIDFDKENFAHNLARLEKSAYDETEDIRSIIKEVVPTYQPRQQQ